MQRRTFLRWSGASGAGLPSLGAHWAQAQTAERLQIGLTAVILADQAAFLSRWGDYLTARIGRPVAFVVRESYQSILDLLFAGQINAAWICGYPYVRHQAKLRLLAVPLYQKSPTYQSYLIRHRQGASAINGWPDLAKRVLAYSDPLSNSGWLVPQAQLRSAGLSAQDLRASFFAHSHRNVAEAVSTQLADAGCIDGYVWETMRLQQMAAVANTDVIWKSEAYGFPPIVIRAGDASLPSHRLGEVLRAMQQDAPGQALLQALNLDGFSMASPVLFDSIDKLARSVGVQSR